MNDKPRPIESFKFGSFDFAMWNNLGEDLRLSQSVSIKRNYMDGNGNWQSEEIRLLPQQLNDLALGAQDMFRFWRIGMRQRNQQQPAPESQARNSNAEQAAEQQAEEPAKQGDGNEPEQTELAGVGSEGKGGFAEKVSQSRGGRRSR